MNRHFRSINGIRRRQFLLVWMICWAVDFFFSFHLIHIRHAHHRQSVLGSLESYEYIHIRPFTSRLTLMLQSYKFYTPSCLKASRNDRQDHGSLPRAR